VIYMLTAASGEQALVASDASLEAMQKMYGPSTDVQPVPKPEDPKPVKRQVK